MVYAIRENTYQRFFAIIRIGETIEGDTPYFQAGAFEVIANDGTRDWITKKMNDSYTYTSFPELFSMPGFVERLHDGDLNEPEQHVLSQYKKLYEDMYANAINKHTSRDNSNQ